MDERSQVFVWITVGACIGSAFPAWAGLEGDGLVSFVAGAGVALIILPQGA